MLPSEKRKVAEKRWNRMFSSPRLEQFMKSRAYRTAVPVILLIGLAEHAYWIYHLGKNEPAGFVSRQEWASVLLLTVILFSGCLRYMGYKRAEGFAESLKTLLCMLLFVLYAFYCGAGCSSAAEAGGGLGGGQSYLLEARTAAFAAAAGTALYAIWKWLGAKLTRERRE
ncbi:hypothetical protein PC41400_20915 [Paenibacillus chitinolyticus]|uniref:Uncharacterized protein n=1 Tax=Paenibacillus chitinolyticus TaxID=79263 RepID=A0A410WZV3_9BACL|nr:hypothetical protein [Paenibacillus chitinolyticus]MCY9592858.1 hypothetical protein [Paenibacillus chitinolyticus]MCY9595949.1 hypothetical protein [Paenibacillus chitinolyticus]QAV19986.1 hypothetical protein PC41400_20915 [Paenibacillus chitinolyticus]